MEDKKVLVTGGAGFIGSNLVDYLIQNGNLVTVIDDLSSGYEVNLPKHDNLTFVKGDIQDVEVFNDLYKVEFDIVFHLASSVGNKRSIDFPQRDAAVNALGTINLFEFIRRNNIKKVVVSSSAGIYGELKMTIINESHNIEPDTPYGCSKLFQEKFSLAYGKMYDIDVVCLRYFNVYGRKQRYDQYGNAIPIFVFRAINNKSLEVFGDGEQTRDFINVSDVVKANVMAACASDINGSYNISSGSSISINQVINRILTLANSSSKVMHLNERVGDVKHSLGDISKAKSLFSFSPTISIEEGLTDYIAWAKSLENY